MTKKLPAPITSKTFEKIVSQWARIVKYRESGSVYFYGKADFLRRFFQLINNKEVYQKYFGRKKINLIDAEAFVLEEEEDWETVLKNGEKHNSKIYFIIGIDQVILEKNSRVFTFLEKKEANDPGISFLLFFNLDFSHPDYWPLLQNKSVFIQNTVYHSLHSLKDAKFFIEYLQCKWQMKINEKIKKEIIQQCGTHFWLIKEAVRFLRNNPNANKEQIFEHEQMQWRVEMIWQKFLASEKKAIEKIIKKQKDFNNLEKHSLKFLQKTGWIKKEKIGFCLTIALLQEFIEKQINKVDLSIDKKGRIFLNKTLVDRNFSNKERQILSLLIKNRGKLVLRDRIAKVIWQENWENSYSDWAIDQTISRLRKRLIKVEVSPKIIKTIRGKGFLLSKTLE